MMAVIRAIPVTYRGVRFVSTLEGDWARNLDDLRIRWEYEPEGVKLPDGQNYRSDFYLPALTSWLEVKGPHDQRIDKPALLAEATLHAPGCSSGRPSEIFAGPSGSDCPCRYGPRFPWRQVVIGRAASAGKLTFEAPRSRSRQEPVLAVLSCPVCRQHSFVDLNAAHVCRRCHQDASGGKAYRSGQLPFLRLEPPRGRARKRSA